MTQDNPKADTELDAEIMAILNKNTFTDQVAYSPPLVDDLLADLAAYVQSEVRRARIDELERLAVSDKTGSDFDGWDYLDKRKAELEGGSGEAGHGDSV